MDEKNYHTGNKSFVVYKDWEEIVNELPNDEEAGKLFKALFAFAKRAEEAEFVGALKITFLVMRNAIDRDGQKWEETCRKRSDSGKMGGRPKKAKEANAFSESKCKQKNQNEAKEADRETETDRETNIERGTGKPPALFGQYKNVLFSADDYSGLVNDFGQAVTDTYINKLDYQIETKGSHYNNHAAVIRQWIAEDGAVPKKPAVQNELTDEEYIQRYYEMYGGAE